MKVGFFVLLCFISSCGLISAAETATWEQRGIASWYGGIFQGRKTANGEIYDTYGFTSAHRTLPFGTMLEVTNLENNRSVVVRVNDRGPFVDDRIIDLTYAAAKELDMIRDGVAPVHLKAIADGIPKVFFTIQIGAWADPENVQEHRRRLQQEGYKIRTSLNSDGITRLRIEDVGEEVVFSLVQDLEELGYHNLFIYQETQRN